MEAADAPPPVAAVSPVTGGRLGAVPATAPRAVADAAREARAVQRLWATLRPADRARYMARAAQAVIDELDELVDLLSREQGRPRAEAEVMELLPAVETLQWLAEEGPRILAGERDRVLAHPAPDQARALDLRAARRRRRARPGGRAVRHAAGRRRRRADGRQRRRPQALAARARSRASASRASSPAPGCPRACCASSTATPTSAARSSRRPRSPRCASPARRRAGRAVGEACARGLKRSVLELGGKDAMLVLADANVAARGARRGLGGVRERRPVRRQHRARVRACTRWPTASSPRVVAPRARRCAWATRAAPTTEIGPLRDARAPRAGARARRRGGGGRRDRCTAAGRSSAGPALDRRRSSRRPC